MRTTSKILLTFLSSIAMTGCGLTLPPENTMSRNTYNGCKANLDLMEKAGGSNSQRMISEMRFYCKCSSEILWEAEKKIGWSALEDAETSEKIFNRCATFEMKNAKKKEIAERKAKELREKRFTDSIDSLFK